MNLTKIYEGWKNKLFPDEELKERIEEVSKKRMEICNGCFYHSSNRPGYRSLRPDAHCTDCGCTLSAKTACLSCGCPREYWKAEMTKEQENELDEQAGEV